MRRLLSKAACGVLDGLLGIHCVNHSINGLRYRVPLRCSSLKWLCLPRNEIYEPEVFWATVDLAVDARVVFDIGAHLGKYTVAFARYVAHEGIVVAFEANPITAVALQEIVTLNGLDGAVRVVNRAVSDHLGQISFDPTGSAFDPGQTVYRQVAGKGHTVASTTVDEFVLEAGFRPDVLKIDVEGFELKVLQGASKTLMDSRPRISCEIHPQQLRDLGVTPDAVENFLASVGYRRVHGIVHRHNADDCNRPYNLLFEHE